VALLANLTSRVRLEIGDQASQFNYTATGDGSTVAFSIGKYPVDPSTLYVTVNGSAQATPANYTLEANLGVIHFVTAPSLNAVIAVSGQNYRYFTDTDITTFVSDAVNQHTYNRVDSYGSQVTIGSIPAVEEYPVAVLASIEALWSLATDSAFDINITAPDGVVIPRAQRYQQLSNVIQQRWEQYRLLCSQLNVGLWRIEMGTLIRTSRTTNKYVPIYMGQEVDDSRRPERVYVKNDLTGRNPALNYGQIYDITLYQGDSFSVEFDFPFDTTGYTLTAQMRTYPNSPSLYATFAVTTLSTSSTLSKIQVSLTKTATAYLPTRAFWDLQATSTLDPNYEQTYIRGQVFTIQQVTLD
jgi:hypothetical protein